MVYLRSITAAILAFAVTVGLFFLMQSLIELGKVDLDKSGSIRVIDFVRLKRASQAQTKKRELPKKQRVQNQPAPPSLNLPRATGGGGVAPVVQMSADAPSYQKSVRMSGGPSLSSAVRDAGEIPLVRVNPMYPRGAAEKKIEGYVIVEFDISEKGSVINARAVKSVPGAIFERPALKAIRKWKYKPKVVDGKPIVVRGVQVKLKFELDAQL